MERLSTQTQESGFVSMHSQRSSSQSYTTSSSLTSKRSSQQSSVSYNSQSYNSSMAQHQLHQKTSFSQQKILADTENSIVTHRTTSHSSTKNTVTTTTISGDADSALLEKLVNVGVLQFFCFYFFSFF